MAQPCTNSAIDDTTQKNSRVASEWHANEGSRVVHGGFNLRGIHNSKYLSTCFDSSCARHTLMFRMFNWQNDAMYSIYTTLIYCKEKSQSESRDMYRMHVGSTEGGWVVRFVVQ